MFSGRQVSNFLQKLPAAISYVIRSPFIKPKPSLTFWQEFIIRSYPKPNGSNPFPHGYISHTLVSSSNLYVLLVSVVSSVEVLIHFLPLLHALLPILFQIQIFSPAPCSQSASIFLLALTFRHRASSI